MSGAPQEAPKTQTGNTPPEKVTRLFCSHGLVKKNLATHSPFGC